MFTYFAGCQGGIGSAVFDRRSQARFFISNMTIVTHPSWFDGDSPRLNGMAYVQPLAWYLLHSKL